MTAKPRVAVRLSIEPELCGPISVGTVAVIRLLERHLALPLPEAMRAVERAVWDGAEVELDAASPGAASALLQALAGLPPVPRVRAWLPEALER